MMMSGWDYMDSFLSMTMEVGKLQIVSIFILRSGPGQMGGRKRLMTQRFI